jgi:hypothetical protein
MMPSETIIFDVLAEHTKMGERKREELAMLIDDALVAAGYPMGQVFGAVEVPNARAVVETIEAYDLTVEVDANGRAVTVFCPDGFEVTS